MVVEGFHIGQGSTYNSIRDTEGGLVGWNGSGDEIHDDLIIVVIVSGKYAIYNWKFGWEWRHLEWCAQ